jgi:hypothetical protein
MADNDLRSESLDHMQKSRPHPNLIPLSAPADSALREIVLERHGKRRSRSSPSMRGVLARALIPP